jgi:hypothetical protein
MEIEYRIYTITKIGRAKLLFWSIVVLAQNGMDRSAPANHDCAEFLYMFVTESSKAMVVGPVPTDLSPYWFPRPVLVCTIYVPAG